MSNHELKTPTKRSELIMPLIQGICYWILRNEPFYVCGEWRSLITPKSKACKFCFRRNL